MDAILILVGQGLTSELVDEAKSLLNHTASAGQWLTPPKPPIGAWECSFSTPDLPQTRQIFMDSWAASPLADHPIDIFVVPAANRRKKLFLADMDSTLVQAETLDELAILAGVGDEVAAITNAAMQGKVASWEDSLEERVALLKGLPVTACAQIRDTFKLSDGAETLLKTLKSHGVITAMATGGFHIFADPIAAHLNIDHVFANRLKIDNGCLTGKVLPPIRGPNDKLTSVETLARQNNLTLADCLVIGDGANDKNMVEAVNKAGGLGLSYHGKPILEASTPHRIRHTDLTTVLSVQGYGVKL